HTTDLGMLHLLRVEFDQFKAERADRTPAAYPLHPGERVAEARFQRRRQPASATTAVEKPWLAIADVPLAAGTATSPALIQPGFPLLAAVGELGRPHRLPGRIVDHGQASGLTAWVDLEPQRLRLLCLFTFPQDDGEGISAVDRRPSTIEQVTR